MKLVDKQDVFDALDATEEIKGMAYINMERRIEELPIRAIVRDCTQCMGATFQDCDKCERIVLPTTRSKVCDKLSEAIDVIDVHMDALPIIIKQKIDRIKERCTKGGKK